MYRIPGINDLEYRVFYLIVVLKFFLSAVILNLFINYSSVGGTLIEKLHPSFYILILLLINLLLKKKFLFLFQKDNPAEIRVLFWYVVTLVSLMITFVVKRGTSNMAYLVETFFTASMFALIIFMLNKEQKDKILNMLLFSIFLNSLLAITEFFFKFHLFYIELISSPFRSCAFLGHPLNNALMTSFSIFFVFGTGWNYKKKAFFILINCMAILAYGARAASISVTIGLFLMVLYFFFYSNFKKRLLYLGVFIATWGLPVFLIAGYQLIADTGMGSRLFASDLFDNSGMVRLKLFQIFKILSFNELVFGMSYHHVLATAMKAGVAIIENFWVGFICQFGLLFGLPVLFMMVFMIYVFQKNEAFHLKIASIVFLLVASSNNSLTTKTAALAIFLSLLCVSIKKTTMY